jgi:hypothetical protein
MYKLNYAPTTLGVQNWREIKSGGTPTKKVEYRWSRHMTTHVFFDLSLYIHGLPATLTNPKLQDQRLLRRGVLPLGKLLSPFTTAVNSLLTPGNSPSNSCHGLLCDSIQLCSNGVSTDINYAIWRQRLSQKLDDTIAHRQRYEHTVLRFMATGFNTTIPKFYEQYQIEKRR